MFPKFSSLRSKIRPSDTGRTDAAVPGKSSSGITGPSARGQGTLPLPSARSPGLPLAQRTSTSMSLRPRGNALPPRTDTLPPYSKEPLLQAARPETALARPPQHPQRIGTLKEKPPPSYASLHPGKPALRPAAKARPTLFQGEGNRFSIAKENGEYVLRRDPKPIKNMILSGAGAKGVAYPGALRAMHQHGMMGSVRNVVGSSAGALMGAMIAAGIDEKELTRFSNEVDFMDLIRKESKEAMEAGAQSAKEKSSLAKKLTLVKTIATSLGTKAPMLDEHIDNATRKSTLAGIEHSPARQEPEVDAIYQKLHKGGSVTFQDLRTLNRHLPETFKEFHCTATLFMEGKKTGQLAVLNADTAPDMPVYEAAHMSAALPTLFLKAKVHGGGFEVGGGNGKTYAIDGGVLMNYPIPELLNGGIENAETTENLTIMA